MKISNKCCTASFNFIAWVNKSLRRKEVVTDEGKEEEYPYAGVEGLKFDKCFYTTKQISQVINGRMVDGCNIDDLNPSVYSYSVMAQISIGRGSKHGNIDDLNPRFYSGKKMRLVRLSRETFGTEEQMNIDDLNPRYTSFSDMYSIADSRYYKRPLEVTISEPQVEVDKAGKFGIEESYQIGEEWDYKNQIEEGKDQSKLLYKNYSLGQLREVIKGRGNVFGCIDDLDPKLHSQREMMITSHFRSNLVGEEVSDTEKHYIEFLDFIQTFEMDSVFVTHSGGDVSWNLEARSKHIEEEYYKTFKGKDTNQFIFKD